MKRCYRGMVAFALLIFVTSCIEEGGPRHYIISEKPATSLSISPEQEIAETVPGF